jgi:endonuclease/exonuclease/phosphatase family metal-dependent hydrolase
MILLNEALLLFLPRVTEGQQILKIMSYNIQGMRPGSDPQIRLADFIENLKRIDPDIVGLQEVNETKGGGGRDSQARAIAESLRAFFGIPYQWNCGPTLDAWSGLFSESNAIESKYPIRSIDVRSLELSDYPRDVVWNLIDAPVGKIHFFNTRLSTSGPTPRAPQGGQVRVFVQDRERTVFSAHSHPLFNDLQ